MENTQEFINGPFRPNVDNKVIKKLERITTLPTIPAVFTELNRAVKSSETSARDIAGIIEDDPSIMVRVLKLVKTSFYAAHSGKEITSIQHAIARLGFSALRNIVLTTSIFSIFKNVRYQLFNPTEFWKHSISTGFACGVIRRFSNSPTLQQDIGFDELHLMGLLHDIGKIVLQEYFNDKFLACLELSMSRQIPLYQAEQEIFNTDHGEIGAWLATRWELNPAIISVIRNHHQPLEADEEHKPFVALVHIADYVCNYKRIGNSGNSNTPVYSPRIWKYLSLSLNDIPQIVAEVEKQSLKSDLLLALM